MSSPPLRPLRSKFLQPPPATAACTPSVYPDGVSEYSRSRDAGGQNGQRKWHVIEGVSDGSRSDDAVGQKGQGKWHATEVLQSCNSSIACHLPSPFYSPASRERLPSLTPSGSIERACKRWSLMACSSLRGPNLWTPFLSGRPTYLRTPFLRGRPTSRTAYFLRPRRRRYSTTACLPSHRKKKYQQQKAEKEKKQTCDRRRSTHTMAELQRQIS